MESEVKTRKAENVLAWLFNEGIHAHSIEMMQSDASPRRYYRVQTNDCSLVVMDASACPETISPYVQVSQHLREHQIHAPEVFKQNLDAHYLLISDFGDQTYLKVLNSKNALHYYHRALDTLSVLQTVTIPASSLTLPRFTADFMYKEWLWHKEWFLTKFLELAPDKPINHCYEDIIEIIVQQPNAFMHRDYHSSNLMDINNEVGVLDFQDAFVGPVTYDLMSLIRDCYIDWPQVWVKNWIEEFYFRLRDDNRIPPVGKENFTYWCDCMALQRHLKALMTFARKSIRDHQDRYLGFMPRTLNYIIEESSHYHHLKPLSQYYKHTVMDRLLERMNTLCVE